MDEGSWHFDRLLLITHELRHGSTLNRHYSTRLPFLFRYMISPLAIFMKLLDKH
ncbi:hypothetical protein LINGRAHAP2_LOCUS30125 [Linum grandiflorum]